ncbi:MAG: 4Fe-4S binding protein [Planctomycetes bacterium]|nr:4Fe-4S binding protein [Planctomycetota bacterium]
MRAPLVHGELLRHLLVRAWRLGAVLAIGALVAAGQRADRLTAPMPLALREVAPLLPGAAALDPVVGPLGQLVRDAAGGVLGSALTTAPAGDRVIGYAGPTEVLVAVDVAGRVAGARIRRSADTPEHVADVVAAVGFWRGLAGRPAAELAGRTAAELRIDGVSGATRTSAAAVDAIGARLAGAFGEARVEAPSAVSWRDLALAGFAVGGVVLAFLRRARRARVVFRIAAVAWLGVASGELLALSLSTGFALHGLPWWRAPGLALLAATALLVPWATGRSPYCAHVCPHGALQEWLARATRGRLRRRRLPEPLRFALIALPATLLLTATFALVTGLPLDLASIEAFDAWLLGAGAAASVAIAAAGLAAAAVEPMAYCRFGCATGQLLALPATRARGAPRLRRSDLLLATVLLVALLAWLGRDALRAALMEVAL